MGKSFKENILDKIKNEDIKPISKSYFSWKNRWFWFVLIITIIVIWITFSFFVNDFKELLSFWAKRGNSIFFLPNIFWLVVMAILIFIWIKEFRKTKYGYKTSLTILILYITIVSSVIWLVFIYSPHSRTIHRNLVEALPFLSKYIYNESAWNQPKEGRLIWTIKEINKDNIILTSIDWTDWTIDTKSAFYWKYVVLKVWEKIRVLWVLSQENTFEATKFMPYFGMWGGMWNGQWKWHWMWGGMGREK